VIKTPNGPPDCSYLREALRKSLTSGKFLDGQIRAYRGKCKEKKLTRLSSIYFSTASIPPSLMNRIRHGMFLDLCLIRQYSYLLVESMTCPPSEHEYDSDSDLEDDEEELPEELKLNNAGGSGKVYVPTA